MPEHATVPDLVSAFSEHLDRNERKLDEMSARINKADLNGSAPILRNVARTLGPKLDALVSVADNAEGLVAVARAAPEITKMVKEQEDRAAMSRAVKRIVRWDQGTSFVVKALVTGLAAAITIFTVAQVWPHNATPNLPSSRPSVVTPMPTASAAPPSKATP